MRNKSRNSISILSWNISGAFNKIAGDKYSKLNESLTVSRLLSSQDIFILTETHCSYADKINFEGYFVEPIIRPKSPKAPGYSGGLAIGVKESIRSGIKYLGNPTNCPEYTWMRLYKEFFNMPHDIYLLAVYVPPVKSPVHKIHDIFSLIEDDIAKYSAYMANAWYVAILTRELQKKRIFSPRTSFPTI